MSNVVLMIRRDKVPKACIDMNRVESPPAWSENSFPKGPPSKVPARLPKVLWVVTAACMEERGVSCESVDGQAESSASVMLTTHRICGPLAVQSNIYILYRDPLARIYSISYGLRLPHRLGPRRIQLAFSEAQSPTLQLSVEP